MNFMTRRFPDTCAAMIYKICFESPTLHENLPDYFGGHTRYCRRRQTSCFKSKKHSAAMSFAGCGFAGYTARASYINKP